MTHYRVLQVAEEASAEVIAAAYEIGLAQVNKGSSPSQDINQKSLHLAYETLGNKEARANYDQQLKIKRWLTAAVIILALIGGGYWWGMAMAASTVKPVVATPTPPPPTPTPSPISTETSTPEPVAQQKPSYEPGEVFYFEDFSKVERGYLPDNWTGGEKLIVETDNEKHFVKSFEKAPFHSAVVTDVEFPENYELECIAKLDYRGLMFTTGSTQAGIDNDRPKLNDTKAPNQVQFYGKTVKLTVHKKDAIVKLFANGKELLIGRYPESGKTPNSFSLEFGDKTTIYSLKGTAL